MSKRNRKFEAGKLLVKNKRRINIAFGIWLIINGLAFFPIKFADYRDFSEIILWLMTTYVLILAGNLYKTANQSKGMKLFIYAFILNSIGLIVRIAIEYGEASMESALTVSNVLVYIVLIPCLFALGGLFKDITLVKYD